MYGIFRNYLNTLKEFFLGGGGGELLWIRKSLCINFAFLQAILRMKLNFILRKRYPFGKFMEADLYKQKDPLSEC